MPVSEPAQAPLASAGARARPGFLPFATNLFDRIFIGVVLLVAIHLLWMRFLEASLPLWVATIISLVLAAVIARRG